MITTKLTHDRLLRLLHYNPESGIFTWNVDLGSRARKGDEAGTINKAGYVVIQINGCKIYAHRLAFLYMEGKLPDCQVDHINRNKLDNRWCNLRHSNNIENNRNKETTLLYAYKGGMKSITELSDMCNIERHVIYQRIVNLGWKIEEALTTPVEHKYGRK